MPDQDPNEFTEREKFLLSYYRSPELSNSPRVVFFDLAIGLASIACIAKFVMSEEMAFGFIGYALVLGRLCYLIIEGGRWSRDLCSIFTKYDAKLRELTEAQREKDHEPDVN